VATLEGYVWDLQFGEDGRYFATASMEPEDLADASGDSAGYNPAAGQMDENSSTATYSQITMEPDNSNVAIWDAERLEKVGDLDGAREVYKMALVPGERALLTAGDEVRVWEFITLEQAGQIADPSMVMQRIGVGSLVVVSVLGMAAGAAVGAPFLMLDPLTTTQLLMLPAALTFRPEACIRSVAISPDGKTIVSTTKGPSHNVMAVIDRASDKVVDKWTADVYVCDMAFSQDGKYLLTATTSGIFIYNTTDWKKTNLKNIGAK
jgi:WD40 repeat protein